MKSKKQYAPQPLLQEKFFDPKIAAPSRLSLAALLRRVSDSVRDFGDTRLPQYLQICQAP